MSVRSVLTRAAVASLFAASLIALIPSTASAEEAQTVAAGDAPAAAVPDKPKEEKKAKAWHERYTPSARMFAEYMIDLAPANTGSNGSAFDITRVYIELKGKIDDDGNAEFRYTQDVARRSLLKTPTSSDAYIGTNLKYAYVDFKKLIDGVKITFGQHARPWGDNEDKFRGTRYITTNLLDFYKYEGSTDLGASISSKGESSNWHFMIGNGEGDKKPEDSRLKDFYFRYTMGPSGGDPSKDGFFVNIGASYGWKADRSGERSRLMVLIASNDKKGVSWGLGLYQMMDEAADITSVSGLPAAFGGATSIHGGGAQFFTTIALGGDMSLYIEGAYVDPSTGDDEVVPAGANPGTILRGIVALQMQAAKNCTTSIVYLSEQRKGSNGGTIGLKTEIALK
jgi:hypothetical protein